MQLWVPLLAALFGGLASQFLAALLAAWRRRRTSQASLAVAEIVDGAKIRAELWAEIDELRKRIDELTSRLDESRRSYLELLQQHATLEAEHRTLKAEHAELQEKYEQVLLQLEAIQQAGYPHIPADR